VARARIRRKDLKKPDEFITLTTRGLDWIRAHTHTVAWVGGVTVVALASVAIVTGTRAARRREANADLGRAMAVLRGNDAAGAAAELRQVIDRWGNTPLAPLARVLAANAALDAGKPDEAIELLGGAEASSAELPSYIDQQIQFVWGAALEAKGSWSEAAARYEAASTITGPYTAQAILGEARSLEQAGQADRAKELYRKAYEQFPDLPDRDVVASKIEA
jgi:tetratricopeptide (TPR) repeat protein